MLEEAMAVEAGVVQERSMDLIVLSENGMVLNHCVIFELPR